VVVKDARRLARPVGGDSQGPPALGQHKIDVADRNT
jgi:hypothetical protein